MKSFVLIVIGLVFNFAGGIMGAILFTFGNDALYLSIIALVMVLTGWVLWIAGAILRNKLIKETK